MNCATDKPTLHFHQRGGAVGRCQRSVAKKRSKKPGSGRKLRLSRVVDTRVIYCGDNLDHLERIPDNCIDLIYIDPPFHSNRNYESFWNEGGQEKRAFEDRHASIHAYLDFMRPRCQELARVLSRAGSFYFHCDWHASHYIKVMLDQMLGPANFRNHIVWKRSSAHSDAKQGMSQCGRICDFILFYTGGAKKWTWNTQYQPYDDEYAQTEYRHKSADGRYYKESDVTAAKPGGDTSFEWRVKRKLAVKQTLWVPDLDDEHQRPRKGWQYEGVLPYRGRYWAYSRENLLRFWEEGRLHHRSTGMPRLMLFADEMQGIPLQDLWSDIKPIGAVAKERVGYPTQKPLALLERIIKASTNPGDIVLDAFCGCGTALEAAETLQRQWIGIDISPTACRVMSKRIRDKCYLKEDEKLWQAGRGFVLRDLPWTEDRLRSIPPFEFENWAVIGLQGVPNKVKVGDMGIDGRIYLVDEAKQKMGAAGEQLTFTEDLWYPVQVKQKDKVGRPDIDSFEAAMIRFDSDKGFFVGFDYTEHARREIRAFKRKTGKEIIAITVGEILEEEEQRRWA